jgi:hypothetical protein
MVPMSWQTCHPAGVIACFRDTKPTDGFLTNVNLVVEPFSGGVDDYVNANKIALSRQAQIERQWTVPGAPMIIVVSLWPTSYRTEQIFAVSGGHGYVLTCSASATAFEQERPRCEAILHSLHVP